MQRILIANISLGQVIEFRIAGILRTSSIANNYSNEMVQNTVETTRFDIYRPYIVCVLGKSILYAANKIFNIVHKWFS